MRFYPVAVGAAALWFSVLVGSWYGGALAPALPLLTLSLALGWAMQRRRSGSGAAAAPADRASQAAGQPGAPQVPAAACPAADQVESVMTALLDHIDLPVFRTDASGHLVYVNRAWETLGARSSTELPGLALWAIFHPADQEGAEKMLRALGSGELIHGMGEFRMVAANGNVVWVSLRARPCNRADGSPLGLCGTLEDVTRRRRLSESLKSTHRQVNTLLANVPGMAYRGRNDPDWTMEFVSDGCFELTGYEAHELVGSAGLRFGRLIHPEDREFVWTEVQSHLAQRKPYQISYRITDAAGRERWVWEQGRGIFSSHGEFLAIEGFITDVSERRGAEEQAKRRLWFEARTGLVGRAIFEHLLAWTLQHAQLAGHRCALLWVDAFGIAELAERQAADASEPVLTALARRMRPAPGPGMAATWLGDHQFAVLVTDFRPGGALHAVPEAREAIPAAAQMAGRLAQTLMAPLQLGQKRCTIAVSVGIALSQARYADAEAMLQAARSAARQAREMGPGHCEFADE